MSSLDKTLDLYLVKKAPALPKNIKDILVKLAPWGAILVVVFSIPAILAMLGFGAMMYGVPYGGYAMARTGFNYTFPVLFLVAIAVLKALAIPGLMKRTMDGWNFAYYAVMVEAVYNLINFQLFSLLIGTTLSLYFLFQLKSYYK